MTAFTPLVQRAASKTANSASGPATEPLWLEWFALAGMLAFGGWLLGLRGVWALLLTSDPTGLTLVITAVFVASTLWCGARSRELQRQRGLLAGLQSGWQHGLRTATARPDLQGPGWAGQYLAALQARPQDDNAPLDLLVEAAQGPHHTAWWVNGIQLKLGLLGKVIGFSVLALQIGQIQSLDATQSQDLLKSLTAGLGIALLTTMLGLVGKHPAGPAAHPAGPLCRCVCGRLPARRPGDDTPPRSARGAGPCGGRPGWTGGAGRTAPVGWARPWRNAAVTCAAAAAPVKPRSIRSTTCCSTC